MLRLRNFFYIALVLGMGLITPPHDKASAAVTKAGDVITIPDKPVNLEFQRTKSILKPIKG